MRSSATPESSALPARRALVADDSLVARIFLARLLERRGYVVDLVGDGESMWRLLSHGPWSLVCADVTMPDVHGRAHIERLLDFRAACREPFRLIVLTRDVLEEQEAELAGAVLHLRKPFDPASLDQLLGR
jgi:CheY-like chemotaxis protein